jgi:hypothetical protein
LFSWFVHLIAGMFWEMKLVLDPWIRCPSSSFQLVLLAVLLPLTWQPFSSSWSTLGLLHLDQLACSSLLRLWSWAPLVFRLVIVLWLPADLPRMQKCSAAACFGHVFILLWYYCGGDNTHLACVVCAACVWPLSLYRLPSWFSLPHGQGTAGPYAYPAWPFFLYCQVYFSYWDIAIWLNTTPVALSTRLSSCLIN